MATKVPAVQPGSRSSIPENPEEITLKAAAVVAGTKTEITNRIDLGLFDGVILEVDVTLGSLTSYRLYPEFADTDDAGATDYKAASLKSASSSGQVDVTAMWLEFDADGTYHVVLKKQGRYLRLLEENNGAVGGSSTAVVAIGAADIEDVTPLAGGGAGSNVTIIGPLGQAAMAASVPVVIASDQSALTAQTEGTVDANNSTTATLGGGATFTGTATDLLNVAHVTIGIFADQASAADGLAVEWSSDGTNWDDNDLFTIAASTGKVFSFGPPLRYMRVVYTNGATPQGAFRMQTILKGTQIRSSTHRISDPISIEDDAELSKAVLTGLAPSGSFVNIDATNAGSMKVSLEEVNGVVVPISNDDTVDAGNSTTTPLGSAAVFTGTGVDCLGYSAVCVTLATDEDSVADGMQFQFSSDNSNWDDSYDFTMDVSSSGTRRFQFAVTARYFRVVYTNDTSAQGFFRVQTILHRQNQLTSIHRLVDNASPDRSAQVVKSALIAQQGGGGPGAGDFIPVQATAGGNLRVAVEEIDDPNFPLLLVGMDAQKTLIDGASASIEDIVLSAGSGLTQYAQLSGVSIVITGADVGTDDVAQMTIRDHSTSNIVYKRDMAQYGGYTKGDGKSKILPEAATGYDIIVTGAGIVRGNLQVVRT